MQGRSISLFICSLLLLNVFGDLPSGMIGNWVGFPSASPIGPWGSNQFNFTIQTLQNSASQWLMTDYFSPTGDMLPGSVQQFWVQEGVGVDYCGIVDNFFGPPAPIDVNFTQSMVTTNQIRWCTSECAVNWTLTLQDENTLNSHLYLESPVVHIDVTFKRNTNAKKFLANVDVLPPPCNISLPHPPKRSGCPHAAAFRKTNEKSEILASPVNSYRRLPSNILEDYQYCYIMNPAVEYAVAWNINRKTKMLDIALTLPTNNPTGTYLGFGFEPEFPAMEGADVVMGYTINNNSSDCVRSMYVPYYVGPPVDDTKMIISNTNVVAEADRLSVYFTRAFDTGYHNITINHLTDSVYSFTIMWAFGAAPHDCVSTPAYHGYNRGVRMLDWSNPSRIFPDWMKC